MWTELERLVTAHSDQSVKHHAVLECLMEVRQVRVNHNAVLECLMEFRQVRVNHHAVLECLV